MQMHVADAFGEVGDGHYRIVAPEHGVGHIHAQTAPIQPGHEALPLVGAVHEVAHVKVEGDRNAQRLGVGGEVFVDGGHAVEELVAGGALALGHDT